MIAIQNSMIINSIEFYLYNNSEYINSGSSSTSYLKSIIPFFNNSVRGFGKAIYLHKSI